MTRISRLAEEYLFGAIASIEEKKGHKVYEKPHWPITKRTRMRCVCAYAILVGVSLTIILLCQSMLRWRR